ncbi:hypothetical protein [Paraburkholderia sp. SIMBA_027]|uniref:hypothetical protein n=1 Tax=Paraburkholderia sp. SIMBA_027 TaxID=3085770 RepID=UPI003979E36E
MAPRATNSQHHADACRGVGCKHAAEGRGVRRQREAARGREPPRQPGDQRRDADRADDRAGEIDRGERTGALGVEMKSLDQGVDPHRQGDQIDHSRDVCGDKREK